MANWLTSDGPFIIGGCILLALALLVLYRALLHDRSRGRRRCPRCWYSMEGVPGLTCPECGNACEERRLHRTRRRWGRAAAGALVLALAMLVLRVPSYRRTGWYGLIPSSVLVVIAPPQFQPISGPVGLTASRLMIAPTPLVVVSGRRTAGRTASMVEEIWERIEAGRLARWQSQVYIGRLLRSEPRPRLELPARWVAGHELRVPVSTTGTLSMLPARARIQGAGKPSRIGSRTYLRTPARAGKRVPVYLEVYQAEAGADRLLYAEQAASIDLYESTASLMDRVSGPEADAAIRGLLNPRLVWEQGEPVLRIDDRLHGANLPYAIAVRAELLIAGIPVGHANGVALDPCHRVLKPWLDMPIRWMPGGREQAGGGVTVVFRSDPAAAGEMYLRHASAVRPACWEGSLTFQLGLEGPPGSPP